MFLLRPFWCSGGLAIQLGTQRSHKVHVNIWRDCSPPLPHNKNTNKSFAGEQNFEETTRNILQFANALSDNTECKTINPALAMSSKIDSHWFGNRNHVRLWGIPGTVCGTKAKLAGVRLTTIPTAMHFHTRFQPIPGTQLMVNCLVD